MAESGARATVNKFGSTLRRDAWWIEFLPVVIVLGGFGLYATLRAFKENFTSGGRTFLRFIRR
jgi:hypothetical protein